MKETIFMTIIGLVIILILSWAVTAVASSYNAKLPSTAVVSPDYGKVVLDETAANQVAVDESRTAVPEVSELPRARTNH